MLFYIVMYNDDCNNYCSEFNYFISYYNRYLTTTTTTTMDYVYVDSFWLDDWSICFDYEVRVRDLTDDDDDDDDNNDNDDI